jgi:hypothetical protein
VSKDSGLFTDSPATFNTQVNSIPLSDVDSNTNGSIGELVTNATEQMSSLVRAEVELAKAELTREAKKGAIGGGLFGIAGTVALYSSFFFFFFLAELLDVWMLRWAAFLVVFIIMLVFAGIVAFFGYRKIRKIQVPQHTLESVNELKALVPGKAEASLDAKNRGLYS